jgi:hypothetical protein
VEVEVDPTSPIIDVGDTSSTMYANTDLMAMKLMTSREKKANKKTKPKKKATGDPLNVSIKSKYDRKWQLKA